MPLSWVTMGPGLGDLFKSGCEEMALFVCFPALSMPSPLCPEIWVLFPPGHLDSRVTWAGEIPEGVGELVLLLSCVTLNPLLRVLMFFKLASWH